MLKERAAAILAIVGASEPRHSKRVRRATQRFVEGWFGAHLPRLSLALSGRVTDGEDAEHAGAEVEASLSEGNAQADDESQTPSAVGEVREAAVVGASENRRSERPRRATGRFLEGYLGVLLPRLSLALGVGVADRQED